VKWHIIEMIGETESPLTSVLTRQSWFIRTLCEIFLQSSTGFFLTFVLMLNSSAATCMVHVDRVLCLASGVCSARVSTSTTFSYPMAWLSGNALVSINVVTLRRARLVLGWVTVYGRVKHLGI